MGYNGNYRCSICGEIWTEGQEGECIIFCEEEGHGICINHFSNKEIKKFEKYKSYPYFPKEYCDVCNFKLLDQEDVILFLKKMNFFPEEKYLLNIAKSSFDTYGKFVTYLLGYFTSNEKTIKCFNSFRKKGVVINKLSRF
jgi:hypothetical protein